MVITRSKIILLLIVLNSIPPQSAATSECRSRGEGRLIGALKSRQHGVEGVVYAVDDSLLFINNFAYDGGGPEAFFWIGSDSEPSEKGMVVPYPLGSDRPLTKYNGSAILLRLPEGRTLRMIKWLAVWCRRLNVSFGEVKIPKDVVLPRPRVLPEFLGLAHGLSSGNVTILDAKTFHIPELHYDGRGPNAFFLVGNGTQPDSGGVRVPDETGSFQVLHRYSGENITIQLPGHLTACDIDWLAVYCIKYKHDFGHVYIPKDLDVPPFLGQNENPTQRNGSTNRDNRFTAITTTLQLILIFSTI